MVLFYFNLIQINLLLLTKNINLNVLFQFILFFLKKTEKIVQNLAYRDHYRLVNMGFNLEIDL